MASECNDIGAKGRGQQFSRETSRRDLLLHGAGLSAVAFTLASGTESASADEQAVPPSDPHLKTREQNNCGDWIVRNDGTRIVYKDWVTGQPVVFSHGWPLQADVWDPQMMFLGNNGFRVVAHDRRSHGRSTQTWSGNDLDTYADDLSALIEALNLTNVILVGHSTGAGEVTRYIGRHGTKRVAKIVLLSTITPHLLKTPANPKGVPLSALDGVHADISADRSQFYKDLSISFYGGNRPGAKVSQGTKDAFWLWSMQVGLKGAYDCLTSSFATNFKKDLERIDRATLIIHGGDDQIVPITDTALPTSHIVSGSILKIYEGAPHGLFATNQEQLNMDLLNFAKA